MSACAPRWATPRTESRQTLGGTAATIAEALGTPLMAWQRQVLDTALEVDPAGHLAFRDVVLTVPRQSGKTTIALALIILRALSAPRQQIRYTSQTGLDARKKWSDDWLPVLEQSPFTRYFKVRMANGHEALLFNNGSIQSLVSTTAKSGHGASIDLAILDESFAHPDARLEQALRPAMITRQDPQLWVVSTAGTPDASPYLWAKVESGRQFAEAGLTEGLCYFEWSAADDADPGDPETWRSCMPALGTPVREESVASDFRAMDDSEFRRAYLNQWVTLMAEPVIPLEAWNVLSDTRSTTQDPIALAFDVTPDRSRAAIGVAGRRPDGRWHVEVVDHRPGTKWVAGRLEDLIAKHRPSGIFCDAGGPAGSLLDELERNGLEVTAVSAREHGQACGIFYDAVMEGNLAHLGQPELTAALDGAVKRSLGDAWAWSRKSSSIDISPLVACTIALWGAGKAPERTQGIWSISEEIEKLRAKQQANGEPVSDVDPMNSSAPPVIPTGGGQGFISFKEFYR